MTARLTLSLAWLATLVCLSVARADSIIDALLKDVTAVACRGNPASMVVWGDAVPLVVAPDGRVFAAADQFDSGRVVALGHGGFISSDAADSETLAANAIAWLSAARRSGEKTPVRIFGLNDVVAAELERRSFPFERMSGSAKQLDLDKTDVVIGSTQAFAKAQRLDELESWLRRGGGLLATETAWGILQLNPKLTIRTLAANRLMQQAGIFFTDEAHSAYGANGDYPIDRNLLATANANAALSVLSGARDGNQQLAARIVGDAVQWVPPGSALIRKMQQLQAQHRDEFDEHYRRLAKQRITPNAQPLLRALFDLDARLAAELPPDQIEAHPSHVAFPGAVGKDRVASASIKIDPTVPGWHSTGLYAPPGEVVTVVVPPQMSSIGASVQIGAWRDPHSHAYRVRMKNALRRFSISATETKIASAIGGPIYLVIPQEAAVLLRKENITIDVRGAVAAPHYRHGVTTLKEWRERIRKLDAPWAEMASDKLIFTVPSSAIRELERPGLVMSHWDRVHAVMQSLEPRTDNHWADRPYRYVADASVSWGYMYCPANNPIVIPLKEVAPIFEVANFDADGPNHLWGHYHEMGHAHQNPLWTDDATTEVTVNIFTVYALHKVNGYPLDSEVMRSDLQTAWNTFNDHRKTGKPYEAVGGPFPRLQFYALLWHNFGFDAFHSAFDRLREDATLRPKNKADERNAFLIHFSEAVGRDLSAYFDAWGIEVFDASRKRLAQLPKWMPTAP